jgi:carboxylesterase
MNKPIPIYEHPELDGKTFFLNGNQIGVLLIHGFTATTVEVRWLAEFFNNKGLCVSAPLLPGHGTTPEDLNKRRYSEWIGCVESAYYELKNKCSIVIVGGESMGAVLSLYLAEKYPQIKALLLFSPAMKIASLRYSKIFRYFKPIIQKKYYDEIMPWQGYNVYPLFAASEFLRLQKLVIQNLRVVQQPIIIFHGAYDRTIDTDSTDVILSSVNSSIKTKQVMLDSGHVILLDKEFTRTADITWKFLQELKIVQ